MHKLKKIEPELKTGKIGQACMRYGVGMNTMREIASEAKAVIRIGRCYLINFTKVDDYIDSISGRDKQ